MNNNDINTDACAFSHENVSISIGGTDNRDELANA